MAYERVNWENLPSTNTPVNADNLNKMDEGIANIDTKINSKQDKLIAGTGIEITGENIINNIQENYSTEEVKIGTWIDGKPLYRKVFESTTYSTQYIINTPNIENLINVKGMINRSDYTYIWQPIPSRLSSNTLSIDFGLINATSPNSIFGIIYGTDWSKVFKKIIIIIEYTKTTD